MGGADARSATIDEDSEAESGTDAEEDDERDEEDVAGAD